MSDRVTNAEVEDVLSSIRRLVSEDNRPGEGFSASVTGSFSQEPQGGGNEARIERLVLTPALRVADEAAGEPQQNDQGSLIDDANFDAEELDGTTQPDLRVEPSDGEMISEAEAIKSLADDYSTDPYNFEDETNEDGDQPFVLNDAQLVMDAPEDDTGAGEISDPVEMSTSEPDTSLPSAVHADTVRLGSEIPSQTGTSSGALGAKIEALETAIGEISDIWEPDHAGESDYAGTAPQEMTWEDEDVEPAQEFRPILPPVSLKSRQQDTDDVATPDQEPADESASTAGAFTSTRTRPIFLDETAAPDDPVAEDMEESGEPSEAAALSSANNPNGLPDDELEFEAEEQFLDEEVLREMVGDIVRAELQGPLGERITRNVRKLVRREIHRALAAQELE